VTASLSQGRRASPVCPASSGSLLPNARQSAPVTDGESQPTDIAQPLFARALRPEWTIGGFRDRSGKGWTTEFGAHSSRSRV